MRHPILPHNHHRVVGLITISPTAATLIPRQLFWLERGLYVHERSNRFYSPSSYFVSKVCPAFRRTRLVVMS
jgi:hypothetical protein